MSRENTEKQRYIKMIVGAVYVGRKISEKIAPSGRKMTVTLCPRQKCPWQRENGETVTCGACGCVLPERAPVFWR